MKTLSRFVLICFLLPVALGEGMAQSENSGFKRLFRTYTTRDGLAQLQVRSLARDAYGQVWVGTQNGLSRFDGERILSFGRQHGLPRGTITDLIVDARQRIWGATRSELFVFDGIRARVFPLPGEPSQPTLIPLDTHGLLVRRNQRLLFFRDSAFAPISVLFPFLDDDTVYEVTQIDPIAGRLAIFEEGGQELWLIDPKGGGYKRIPAPGGVRVHLAVSAAGRPWVDLRGADHSLICGLSRDSLVPVIRIAPPGLMEGPESLDIHTLRKDLAPPFFPFATKRGGGLWALEGSTAHPPRGSRAPFPDRRGSASAQDTGSYRLLPGLWFSTINDLVIDEGGRLFMATERGLMVMDLPGWERLEGLPCGNPWSVVPTVGGDTLLVGCHRGGIQCMGRDGYPVHTIGFGGDSQTDHQVFPGFARNDRGDVYFGGYRGVYQWLAEGKVRHWPGPFTVEALAWDRRRGRLLCAGEDLRATGPSGQLEPVSEIPKEISQHVSCTNLVLGPGGDIWIAGWGGVGRLDSLGRWQLFLERDAKLPFESAFSLGFDGKGRLWCGGSEGLAVLCPGENAFRPVHAELFRDQVSQVLFLGADTLIVVGSKECSFLDLRSDPPRMLAFFDHHGSYNLLEPAENGASLDDQGYLWVAAASGIHRLQISGLREHRSEPPIILIDQVNGVPVRQEDLRQPAFTVADDRVIIHFRVLGDMASRAEVLYRLSERDVWLPAGQDGVLILDDLAHGRQRIALRAHLPGWPETKALTTLDLDIRIPFFQRPWPQRLAIATGGLLLLLVLAGAYQQWRSARRMRRLQARIGQARLKTIQAQLNPHFLFNAMVSLQNSIRNRSREEASQQLVRLSRLIRQVLDFSAGATAKEGSMPLTPLDQELSLLLDYVRLEQEQRDPSFQFVLDLDPEVEEENPEVPPLLIQPFVENAILHGLSPLHREGWIRVTISRPDPQTLRYLIEDDGVGREETAKTKVEEQITRRSRGLALMEERISILGDLGLPCRLHISDRSPSGTLVEIHLTMAYADSDH